MCLLTVHALPLYRGLLLLPSSAASIQRVLNAEPTPGVLGALVDFLRVLWGEHSTLCPGAGAAGRLADWLACGAAPGRLAVTGCDGWLLLLPPLPAAPPPNASDCSCACRCSCTHRHLPPHPTTLTIIAGARLFAVVLAALVMPLPLLPLVPHLLLQAYAVAMVRWNSSLCAAPLLTHPLMAGRIRRVIAVMDLSTMLLPGGCVGLQKDGLGGKAG